MWWHVALTVNFGCISCEIGANLMNIVQFQPWSFRAMEP